MDTPRNRRRGDALRAVDGLLDANAQQTVFGGRPLANLATAMAIDFTGADRGVLLLDEGDGLRPAIGLEKDLEVTPRATSSYDRTLVRRARSSQEVQLEGRQLAAPVLVEGTVRGALFLESDGDDLSPESAELAGHIARRIGTLLRSADLVDELTRRTRDLEILEGLGACLAAGKLRKRHLEAAIDGALSATRSDEALLGLLKSGGDLLSVELRGEDAENLRNLAEDLAERVVGGDPQQAADGLLTGPHMFEPLWADLVPTGGLDSSRRPVGFLVVGRRQGAPFSEADRSFFRALAHLLSGALARVDYFNKAAEDPLTETGSRLALQLSLAEAKANAIKTGRSFSVILADLDRFKEINDRHGHLAGDLVLKGVADILRSRLRALDSVARYGGDEFVLILPATGAVEASHLAEELRNLVRQQTFTDKKIRISLSMGVSTFAVESEDFGEVLSKADEALYSSKSAGRDQVTVAE